MKTSKDIVFDICAQMLNHSPEASYKRLNPSLRSTLENCITADLPFKPDTFRRIYCELRGSWWFGDGSGSHIGEGFYSTACSVNHSSAQQSFEHFAERPGVLWEENAATPSRLHVGSQFTWHGRYLTVTSMRNDSLVACSYKDYRQEVRGIKAGATIGYDPVWLITSTKRDGAATMLRVVKVGKSYNERGIDKRFIIRYAEIVDLRRSAKARVKSMLEKIAACDPKKDADKLSKEINSEHFRHFEFEEIRAGFQRRKEWIANEGKIEAWRKGENGAWLDVKQVLVRVNGDRVECSNGNHISRSAAVAVLPVLMAQRSKTTSLKLPLDSYQIDRVSNAGVKIGCTLIPWPEIDRIVPQLNP